MAPVKGQVINTNASGLPVYKPFKMNFKLYKHSPKPIQSNNKKTTSTSKRISVANNNNLLQYGNININRNNGNNNNNNSKMRSIAAHHLLHQNNNRNVNVNANDDNSTEMTNTTAQSIEFVPNPFDDPPRGCDENDIRWQWRTQLEKARGVTSNRKFYASYVGSKKTRNIIFRVPSNNQNQYYCGNHHLKHLVKIGCPMHDLSPLLQSLGYSVNPTICSHKSHLCSSFSPKKQGTLIAQVSMSNVGLIFKRNAFATNPLKIEFSQNGFATDLYIKRIANTNFSKAFRPGSYGKLDSLKKGSWKNGKIFYIFENDELVMNISDNISIVFDLKSSASDGENESNTIDGWKNICGGVGLHKVNNLDGIASVLVLRKHPNFPLECLVNSTISVYANSNMNVSGILKIGNQKWDLLQMAVQGIQNNNNNNNHSNNNNMGNNMNVMQSLQFENDSDSLADSSNSLVTPPRTPSPRISNDMQLMINSIQSEFQNKISVLQHQNALLMAENKKLQQQNAQLIHENGGLTEENERIAQQMQQLQFYMREQHEQITKLNETECNQFFNEPCQYKNDEDYSSMIYPNYLPANAHANVMYPPQYDWTDNTTVRY